MLDARFSHLYYCHSLHTLQRGLSAVADLLVASVAACDKTPALPLNLIIQSIEVG